MGLTFKKSILTFPVVLFYRLLAPMVCDEKSEVFGMDFFKEKLFMTLVKDFIQEIITAVAFCSREERSGSTPNTRTSGDL